MIVMPLITSSSTCLDRFKN